MCGRFFLATPGSELARHFGLAAAPAWAPRFNLAPGQPVPLVRACLQPDGRVERALVQPRWGLVPPWTADAARGRRPINARVEGAAESPLFRGALARRRGLLPADGFYEWQHAGRSSRPFAVRPREGGLLALAAIFERWEGEAGVLETCAVLTAPAAGAVAAIHDRMPVLVAPHDYERWLDPTLRDVTALGLAPADPGRLVIHPVDRRVNDVREDDAGLVEPERDLFSAGGPS